jgi:hypothetical protein
MGRNASGPGWLFSITILWSSALLFLVEPMLGRMVLPRYGGTPAVWNTCLVFFQAALLGGYGYAHLGPSWLGARLHAGLHLTLLGIAGLLLPIAFPPMMSSGTEMPIRTLLTALITSAGPVLFVVAASAPLLQKWFSYSGREPYFLYSASNAGSLAALLSYPIIVEPILGLAEQTRLWTGGYLALLVGIAACALCLWRSWPQAPTSSLAATKRESVPPLSQALRWLWIAFVPSSLLISVTTYLTTDIAAIPLLWALPLALYLLSFIMVFSNRATLPHPVVMRWLPLAVLVVILALLSEATDPLALLIGIHLVGLFWISLACHGVLAAERPPASYLTVFYFVMALGGVLGGTFAALLAPLLFSSIVEYPLVLVLACLVPYRGDQRIQVRDWFLPLLLGGLTAGLALAVKGSDLLPGPARMGIVFVLPLILCYLLSTRPLRFALGLTALLLAGTLYEGSYGGAEYRNRSFFGVHRVTVSANQSYRLLVHGTTIHGQQSLDPERRAVPLSYYHRSGPAGSLLRALHDDSRLERVGVVGLGTGALSCYAGPGHHWTFYEIDPVVVHIARDSGLFTYLADCPARVDVVVGDARQTLAEERDLLGLLIIDAFSSDAIPVHLLTREALAMYRTRLRDDGLLLFHITSRYLDLAPILADLVADADPPMECYTWTGMTLPAQRAEGLATSRWALVGRPKDLTPFVEHSSMWTREPPRRQRPWSDDYSNLWGAIRWKDE